MIATLGVARYEFLMGVRRWGVWVAMGLAALPIVLSVDSYRDLLAKYDVWTAGAALAMILNLLMPVVGGIAIADRLHRDSQLGVAELLRATPLSRFAYVLGKYLGAVGAILAQVLVFSLATGALFVAYGAPPSMLVAQLVAFVGVNVPAYLFIGAFSLACPAVLPLRAYQVLFTGYWFWGNFLNPEAFPTLAGSLLTPSGVYVVTGLFGRGQQLPWGTHTPAEAIANIAILLALAAATLVALERRIEHSETRA